ncbi:Uncharacterised protein [Clostridium putrefaciens]|uniref:Uncharacterized protein n=1 Tax=Clostridium putrefaciens TaxID=99675 RepID=A0A381K6P7_9CLOT|nr:hypothetical protein [Clostridium putrefaciens]SUY72776.1 Uncharacterised protein [Clostridium putrefaciens]
MKINCYSKIKEDTLDKADKLAKDKYYSKAISLIEDNLSLLKEDKELIDKVKEYEGEKGSIFHENRRKKFKLYLINRKFRQSKI